MTDKNSVRILLVEDDTDLRESLVDCLELQGYATKGVPNALSFYQELSAVKYDIAIIDLGLPDQSGMEIVRHLKKSSDMGIVILTALGSPESRLIGYERGADLYLVKPIECRELAAAITNLSYRLGRDTSQTTVSNSVPWTLDTVELHLTVSSGKQVPLAVREVAFLQILMNRPGEKMNRQDVCFHLALDTDNSCDRRLDSMIRRLRKKIKEASGLDLPVQTIYGEGFVFSGQTAVF